MRSAAANEIMMGDGRQSASSSGSSAKADPMSSGDSISRGAAGQPSDSSGVLLSLKFALCSAMGPVRRSVGLDR